MLHKVTSRALGALAALSLAGPALAHGGEIAPGEPPWTQWQFSPEIVLGIAIAAALYANGIRRGVAARPWRHVAFFAGLAALGLALLSPIEPLADHVFAIHQVEHMLLRTIGPMLILLAAPQAALMRGMPEGLRRGFVGPFVADRTVRSVFGFFSRPIVATAFFLGATYFWMWPSWHDLAILNEPIHYFWHVSLLVGGLFFFSVIFDPRSAPVGPRLGVRLAMFWFAAMGNILLGAFLSFKSMPLYHAYDVMGRLFGLDAVADEQIGGLTMWIPGCMMFAFSALLILHKWGVEEERVEARRRRDGTAAIHAAERRADRARANRALALALASFSAIVLIVAFTAAIVYDHELSPRAVAEHKAARGL